MYTLNKISIVYAFIITLLEVLFGDWLASSSKETIEDTKVDTKLGVSVKDNIVSIDKDQGLSKDT